MGGSKVTIRKRRHRGRHRGHHLEALFVAGWLATQLDDAVAEEATLMAGTIIRLLGQCHFPIGDRYPRRYASGVKFNPRIHHRRSIRLRHYDYRSAGAYFVTVCTYERQCIFEEADSKAVAEEVWRTVVGAGGGLIDDFVVMPNHVHGIVWITDATVVGARQPGRPYTETGSPANVMPIANDAVASPLRTPVGPPPGSLGAIVGSFKAATAKRINNLRDTPGTPVWQRNYYEHVIRNDDDLARICQYIRDNPAKWADDPENPENISQPAIRPL